MDQGIEFGDSVPDWIPDRLLTEYQHRAAREVRRTRRSAQRARAIATFRSGDVWLAGLTVFCGLATILALLAAVVYATVVWPRINLIVIAATSTVLFAGSLLIARNTRSRWRSWRVW